MLTAFVFLILHPKRAEILKRFCLLQGLVFLLRTMTITVRTCSTRWIQYSSEIHSFGVYFSIFLSRFECIFWIFQVTLLPNPYKNCKVRSQSSTLETSVFLESFLILHGFRKTRVQMYFFRDTPLMLHFCAWFGCSILTRFFFMKNFIKYFERHLVVLHSFRV